MSAMELKKAVLIIGLLVGMSWAMLAHAGEPFVKGVTEWSFSVGYGENFPTSLKGGNVTEDVKFLPFLVSWGKVMKELTWDASLGYAVEGFFSYAKQDTGGRYAIGVTPLFVYNFNNYKKVIPYVEIGFGIVATDLDPEGFGSDFGFTPQAGIGIRYAVSDRHMIKLAYRYHHISNGGLKDDNQSIDTNFFFIGYSFLH
jgi:opacity protein-like surface antigen